MATKAEKNAYDERSLPIREKLKSVKKETEKLKQKFLSANGEEKTEIFKALLAVIDKMTEEISLNLAVSMISESTIKIKNENFLNNARKTVYMILQYLEQLFGKRINITFDENHENTDGLEEVISNLDLYYKLRVIGYYIDKLHQLYGDKTKWKWTFVELQGRFANAFKNAINYKVLQKNLDASIEGYPERMDLLQLIFNICEKSAERYRNKYELTSRRTEDMIHAIDFVKFQKRLAIILNDEEMISTCTKKSDTWNKKLNDDIAEEERKNKESLLKNIKKS